MLNCYFNWNILWINFIVTIFTVAIFTSCHFYRCRFYRCLFYRAPFVHCLVPFFCVFGRWKKINTKILKTRKKKNIFVAMLSLNFLLDCNVIFNLLLFNSCFLFYELRIFQCLFIFMYFCYYILCPSFHFYGSNFLLRYCQAVSRHSDPKMHVLNPCFQEIQQVSHLVPFQHQVHLSRELWDLVPGSPEPSTFSKPKSKVQAGTGNIVI